MTRIRRLVWLLSVAPLLAIAAPAGRPNIVLIVADDLGHGDLSSYGCTDIKTPAIDSIGRRGVRLTQYYSNASTCTPTRTALLTGRYPQRAGGLEVPIGLASVGRYPEAVWLAKRGELGLPADEATLPQRLLAAGYDTAIVGKWHLGYERKFWPDRLGFKETFVLLGAAADYVTHQEQEPSPPLLHNGQPVKPTGYLTDVFADQALAWLARRRADTPWFLYLPFTAPHEPFQAPGDGPVPATEWKNGTRDKYRQMVEHLDARIADVLAMIARSSAADNTLVIFISDNGAVGKGSNQPFRGYKASLWEGGIRSPCLLSWPRMIPAGTENSQVALSMDLTATLLAAAQATLPTERRLDGLDLLEVLRGKTAPSARTVFWRAPGGATTHKAVRDGDLKYLVQNGQKLLLNLATDPGEQKNLIETMPEKAAALAAKLAAWEAEVTAPRLSEFYAEKAR